MLRRCSCFSLFFCACYARALQLLFFFFSRKMKTARWQKPRGRRKERNGDTRERRKGDDKRSCGKICRFVTIALTRDKTILSACASPRASTDSLILHREHCFQHESCTCTCPFRSIVYGRFCGEALLALSGATRDYANDHMVVTDFRSCIATVSAGGVAYMRILR